MARLTVVDTVLLPMKNLDVFTLIKNKMNLQYQQIIEILKKHKDKCIVYRNMLSFKIKPFKVLIMDLEYGNIHIETNNEIKQETHCIWYFLDGDIHPDRTEKEVQSLINELELILKELEC